MKDDQNALSNESGCRDQEGTHYILVVMFLFHKGRKLNMQSFLVSRYDQHLY